MNVQNNKSTDAVCGNCGKNPALDTEKEARERERQGIEEVAAAMRQMREVMSAADSSGETFGADLDAATERLNAAIDKNQKLKNK